MTHLVMLEALTHEILEVIEKYGDSIPVASAIGVLEVIKFQLLTTASELEDE